MSKTAITRDAIINKAELQKSHVMNARLKETIKRVNQNEAQRMKDLYTNENASRRPRQFESNAAAMSELRRQFENELNIVKLEHNRKTLNIKDIASTLTRTVAMVAIPGVDNHSLAIYDYDTKMYKFNSELLNDYMVAGMGMSSDSLLKSLTMTLLGKRHELAIYNPLPNYKTAVGNGLYNNLTGELEEATPEYTILTKIKTNYIKDAKMPNYRDGFSFEKMMLDFVDGDPNRLRLLKQINKSIVTGQNVKAAMFIILGKGGDGKSTYFTGISNMLGRENVAFLNFSEFNKDDKLVETLNKKLVLGLDNDINLFIRKTSMIKSMASHETMTYSRKYLSAISAPFTATIVQLCNEMPRFAETGTSIQRRMVALHAKNSYYLNGNENANVEEYIKDPRFQEYMLKTILEEETTPFYSDYNDVDAKVVKDTLDSDDLLGQYIDELINLDVLSKANECVPVRVMHLGYEVYMDREYPGIQKLGPRAFQIKIAERLNSLGYELSGVNDKIRPRTLENNGKFSMMTFGYLRDEKAFTQGEESALKSTSRYFIKVADKIEAGAYRKRNDIQISSLQYFNLIANDTDSFTDEDMDFLHDVKSGSPITVGPVDATTLPETNVIELPKVEEVVEEVSITEQVLQPFNDVSLSNKVKLTEDHKDAMMVAVEMLRDLDEMAQLQLLDQIFDRLRRIGKVHNQYSLLAELVLIEGEARVDIMDGDGEDLVDSLVTLVDTIVIDDSNYIS